MGSFNKLTSKGREKRSAKHSPAKIKARHARYQVLYTHNPGAWISEFAYWLSLGFLEKL